MDRLFKIRASQIGKIMGTIGLTEKQQQRYLELFPRSLGDGKPLTELMKKEFDELKAKDEKNELPETCTTYLKEWYANETLSLHNKYIDKGIMCEWENIQFMAEVLEFGIAEKNTEQKETDFMTGCCDVNLADCIIDIKSSWDKKTLHDNIGGINPDYKWQGIGYCILFKKNRFILFYGLMDTDGSINYGTEVIYSDMPNSQRWIAYQIDFTNEKLAQLEKQISDRVLLCRKWLEEYDTKIKKSIGAIHTINLN